MGWFRLGVKVHVEKGNVILSFCSDWNCTCFSGKMLNYPEWSCELIYKKQYSPWLAKENCKGKNVDVISEISLNATSLRHTESLWYCPTFFSSQCNKSVLISNLADILKRRPSVSVSVWKWVHVNHSGVCLCCWMRAIVCTVLALWKPLVTFLSAKAFIEPTHGEVKRHEEMFLLFTFTFPVDIDEMQLYLHP